MAYAGDRDGAAAIASMKSVPVVSLVSGQPNAARFVVDARPGD